MDRRKALQNVALLIGGSIVGGNLFMQTGCKSDNAVNALFKQSQVDMMDEIAETIIPKTNTPGAKDAAVGAFMSVMVLDCYKPEDQKIFLDGLLKIDELSQQKNGKLFMKATPEGRLSLLRELDKEQIDYMSKKKQEEPAHYFRMMKETATLGFFTSEVACNHVIRYEAVPGKYIGDLDYKKGDKVWAN